MSVILSQFSGRTDALHGFMGCDSHPAWCTHGRLDRKHGCPFYRQNKQKTKREHLQNVFIWWLAFCM